MDRHLKIHATRDMLFISERVAIDAAQIWLGIIDDQFGL
jgi:hypothetical protein